MPSELINVRSFRDKYSSLVRNQKECDLFNAQSEWSPEDKAAVANRCQISDDMSFSNAAFVNPTLFHMLRQHREFNEATERELLQQKHEHAAEQEQMRIQRQRALLAASQSISSHGYRAVNGGIGPNGQDASVSGYGAGGAAGTIEGGHSFLSMETDQTHSQLPDQPMDVDMSTVEDALARLATESARLDNSGEAGGNSAEASVRSKADEDEDMSGQSDEDDEVDSNSNGNSNSSSSEHVDSPQPLEPKKLSPAKPIQNYEDINIVTPQSELPQGITTEMLKKAIAASGFARSTTVEEPVRRVVKPRVRVEEPAEVSELETQFRSVKKLLDESTLASLRKVNRRMVPPKYRLEVNFMTNRVQPNPMPETVPVADDEVILSVCFFNTRGSTAKMEEYLVLGSQSLTVLRDAFYCLSDFLVSDHDDQNENTKDRKVSSSYFFIEKTFYNDMRSPSATDYSRVIMEWANDPDRQEKNPHLHGLQSRLMDGARFLDLSIRLRQPYIFMHQGDCEHVMMFTDLRLLGPQDDQNVEAYPKQIFRTRHMRHKCRMCSAYPAQYVTKNDFHSGMSPCYFCEKCYTPFHFDTEGNKLLDHDVFPYAHTNML
ncbi:hypothetical protein IWW36_001481 [Coemansia brasiliensis]|uniref:snRNA-activating protein complex subunit 3 n=1 Tax=Coemansia brasiliensis TaxID=2650707 RepID=A0A9W8IBK6_9FUNG|nr:hypothetical protein IWW36_001481 [Coemansia brasiliensis]